MPLGVADVKREGKDVTIVAWGPAVHDALKAADTLAAEHGVSAEVVDLRSLVPLDMETILASVRKTGRCVVASQCVHVGSFTPRSPRIQLEAFDYLDAPVVRSAPRTASPRSRTSSSGLPAERERHRGGPADPSDHARPRSPWHRSFACRNTAKRPRNPPS